MGDTEGTIRVFCTNDACKFKDMRVIGNSIPKCPECGSQMTHRAFARPQRQYRTY